jgi:alanine racemase
MTANTPTLPTVNDATRTPPIGDALFDSGGGAGRRSAHVAIDSAAIAENWRWFAQRAGNCECAAVIKADAYGVGAAVAARALVGAGARTFFTATFAEALSLRRTLGAAGRIFVLNGPEPETVARFEDIGAMPVLNSLAQIALWAGRGACAVHIDTGMNRLGLSPHEAGAAAERLAGAEVALVMSHLACASTPAHPMNAVQRARFMEAASVFPPAPRSLAASAGAQIGADFLFDMVRPGIGLYGAAGLDGDNPRLATVARVTAPILQVRDVAPGATFGYGATDAAAAPMRTAVAAIGYADGYPRAASSKGFAFHHGRRLPLLGRVSMDLLIFDASAAPEIRSGDTVELLGDEAHIDDVAAAAGTAPYEILTTLVGTVRRAQEAA